MYRARWAILLIIALFSAVIVYVIHGQLQLNGLRGEMRVMLGYLATLQNGYYLETGNYSYFEDYYGASIAGKDHCQQPEAAAMIGFIIKWCHYENSPELRYAYRVLETAPNRDARKLSFMAEAHSGSDALRLSFVCRWQGQNDVWRLGSDKKLAEVETCSWY